MKKILVFALLGASAFILPAASFAAAQLNLYSGGVGQVAGDTQNFGVAVCNGGGETTDRSVPISVMAGDKTATLSSAASIEPGGCKYSYLAYETLGMQAGNTYTISVTIDVNDQTSYTVTVPAMQATAVANNTGQTANANLQFGNFFAMLGAWLSNLFK